MTTLLRAIQLVAEELGRYDAFIADDTASGPDATRQVVCSARIDDELDATAMLGGWLYCTSGNTRG